MAFEFNSNNIDWWSVSPTRFYPHLHEIIFLIKENLELINYFWYSLGEPRLIWLYTHPLVYAMDCKYFLASKKFKVLRDKYTHTHIKSTNLIWISCHAWKRATSAVLQDEIVGVSYKLIPKFLLAVLLTRSPFMIPMNKWFYVSALFK